MLQNSVPWAESLDLIEYNNRNILRVQDIAVGGEKKIGRDVKNLKILPHRKEVFRPFPSVGMGQFQHKYAASH